MNCLPHVGLGIADVRNETDTTYSNARGPQRQEAPQGTERKEKTRACRERSTLSLTNPWASTVSLKHS